MTIRGVLVGAAIVVLAATLVPASATSAQPAVVAGPPAPITCTPGPAPYANLAGASLTPTVHTSADEPAVVYVLWSGTVPSFDGLPLSVDVTVPCAGGDVARPSITMLHGFTDNKTVWEETGKSDTVLSKDRPGANSRWNNIWFASRGYVTLTYTARGWRDSCGPDTPGMTATAPAPRCAGHEYWIHLDDKRWEVRDAQWLTAGLVQSGTADPKHLAITGGSYGGAPTASAAMLASAVRCGAAAVPPELGVDPCKGGGTNGTGFGPWTTPDGKTKLTWAAALPLYTFSDLLRVLAPNGRWSDGTLHAQSEELTTEPFGVPLASTVSGLILAAKAFGTVAPKGSALDSDLLTTTDRLLGGPPYLHKDPVVAGARAYEDFKSPITQTPMGAVPIFWVQGLTDALFPGSEAIAFADHLNRGRAASDGYPIKVFLGDIGHDYAAERQDDWDVVKLLMNQFVDHYLRPDRTPNPPVFDVTASVTRCLPKGAPQRLVRADSWRELANDRLTLSGREGGTTSTATSGPSGVATDPISTATLGGPKSYKGCRILRPAATDPTTVTWDFPMRTSALLVGAPVVDLGISSTGSSLPLAVRMWDVTADGRAQALITRGVYRTEGPMAAGTRIRFQLSPQAYQLPEGHTLRVEVTANDAPYLLANEEKATVRVDGMKVELPVHAHPSPAKDRSVSTNGEEWVLVGVAFYAIAAGVLIVLVLVIVFVVLALSRASRRRRPPGA